MPPDAGAVDRAEPAARIVGELLVLPPGRLAELDRYEGFDPDDPEGSLFRRARTEARTREGALEPCWIYWYAGPAGPWPEVEGGDWRAAGR